MTTLQHTADFEPESDSNTTRGGSVWSRWRDRIIGTTQFRARRGRTARAPIYRITRVTEDRWVVERPGASMEHAFPDLEQAVAFVRHECRLKAATVELRVDDLYVVAELDPNKPSSLFGEAVS